MTAENSEKPNTPSLNRPRITLRQLNALHRQFWAEQSELTERRSSDPVLCAIATGSMDAEVIIGVPLKLRKTLDLALAHAADGETRFQSDSHPTGARVSKEDSLRDFCRKGGKALKGDTLSRLIEDLVRGDPTINEKTLLVELQRQTNIDDSIVISIDEEADVLAGDVRKIAFEDRNGNEKSAPISGLKDRLTRARAKINSR
jgi:hypothetical protein